MYDKIFTIHNGIKNNNLINKYSSNSPFTHTCYHLGNIILCISQGTTCQPKPITFYFLSFFLYIIFFRSVKSSSAARPAAGSRTEQQQHTRAEQASTSGRRSGEAAHPAEQHQHSHTVQSSARRRPVVALACTLAQTAA